MSFEGAEARPLAGEQETAIARRRERWRHKLAELAKVRDACDLPIDGAILDTVTAVNLIGIPTASSCGGHREKEIGERGVRLPYVRIEAPEKPEERTMGDLALMSKVAKRYGTTVDNIKQELHGPAAEEYWRVVRSLPPRDFTPEFRVWVAENHALASRVEKLLRLFYRNRPVPEDVRLVVTGGHWPAIVNAIEVARDEAELQARRSETPFDGKIERAWDDRYATVFDPCREEVWAFTDFLRQKYFTGDFDKD